MARLSLESLGMCSEHNSVRLESTESVLSRVGRLSLTTQIVHIYRHGQSASRVRTDFLAFITARGGVASPSYPHCVCSLINSDVAGLYSLLRLLCAPPTCCLFMYATSVLHIHHVLTVHRPPPPTANAPPLPDAEAAFVSAYGKFPRPALQPPTQPTEQPAPAVAAQQGSMHHHHQRPHWTQHTAPQFTGYGEHPQYTDYAGQQQQQQQYYHPSQPSGQPATPQAQPVVQSSPQHVPSQFVAPSQPPQPQRLHSPAANIQQPYMAPAYAHYPQGSMPPQQAHPAVAPQTLPEHSQQRRYSLDPLIPQHSSTVSHESVTQHQQHAGHAATVDAFQQPQHPQPTQSSPAVPQHQQPPHQWPQPQGASAPQPTQQQHYQARQTPTNMPQDPFSPPPPRAVHQSSTMYAPPPPPPQPQSQAPQPHRQHYYSAPQAMPPVAPVNGGPAVYGAPALAASYQYNAGPAGAPPQHAPPQHTPYTATQPGPMNPAPNGAYNHAVGLKFV